jgi:hypothetical protein
MRAGIEVEVGAVDRISTRIVANQNNPQKHVCWWTQMGTPTA